jgi:putative PIN family toxin of toxin-antitoxin system
MKVVFDTNVYVSAFLTPGSLAEDAFLRAQRKQATLFTSAPILTETARVVRIKFRQGEKDVAAALRLVGRAATIVKPSVRIMVLEDLPDNRILECAAEAAADLIVTGDHHLLRHQDISRCGHRSGGGFSPALPGRSHLTSYRKKAESRAATKITHAAKPVMNPALPGGAF